jgi:hypothetical protein
MDEIMQISGRLCGIFDTRQVHQKIYASGTDLDSIKKAFWTQEEILNQTCRKYGKSVEKSVATHHGSNERVKTNVYVLEESFEDMNMEELLDETEISEWKMCVEGKTNTGRKRQILKRLTMRYDGVDIVTDDERKVGEKEYQFEHKITTDTFGKTPEPQSDTESYNCVDCVLDDEEYTRLCRMFKTWSKADSKIAYFMQNLEPERLYSKEELKEACSENSLHYDDLLTHKRSTSKSKGYGNIMKKTNDTYRLYPELVTEFKKYF